MTIVMETRLDVRLIATVVKILNNGEGLRLRKRSEALAIIVGYFYKYLEHRHKDDIGLYSFESDDDALEYLDDVFGSMFKSRKNAMYLGRQLMDDEVIDIFKAGATRDAMTNAIKTLEDMQARKDADSIKEFEDAYKGMVDKA